MIVVVMLTLGCARPDPAGPGLDESESPGLVTPDLLTAEEPTLPSIGAGVGFSCYVSSAGELSCWGDPPEGMPSGAGWIGTEGGRWRACAMDELRGLECWGLTSEGRFAAPEGSWHSVAADGHYCALAFDGSLTCWGSDLWGQSSPTSGQWLAVDTGERTTCAVAADDGHLECWGDDFSGQLLVPEDDVFIDVSMGYSHGCALTQDGGLRCWGVGWFDDAWPSGPPKGPFTSVHTAEWATCALGVDGVAECWDGWGAAWRDRGPAYEPPDVPLTEIALGGWHACGLTEAGDVWCWGESGGAELPPDDLPP